MCSGQASADAGTLLLDATVGSAAACGHMHAGNAVV